MSILKGTKIKRNYEIKQELLQNIENQFKVCKPELKMKLRDKAISHGIFIPETSPLFTVETDSI